MDNTNTLRVKGKVGITGILPGALLMLLPLLSLLSGNDQRLPLPIGTYFWRLFLALVFASGLRSFVRVLRKKSLHTRLKRLVGLFDQKSRVPLIVASEALGCSLSTLVEDVRAMQKYKLVQGLHADLIRGSLVHAGDRPAVPSSPEGSISSPGPLLREEQRASALPIYALGLSWIIYVLFLPLYRPIDFVLAGIISLIVFFSSSWNSPKRTVIVEIPPERPAPVETGNSALDELLKGVPPHLSDLRRLDRAIDGKLDAPIKDILNTTEQIIGQLKKNPTSAGEVRQFFNYTLPTTIGLLQNYDELSKQPVQGENISKAMLKIESMMDTIVDAFHRQLDALFRDKALDISVELDVMRQMLVNRDIAGTFDDMK